MFYIATGKDAIFLNKELGFKCICFKKQICKIGIPATRIEHYLKKLEELNNPEATRKGLPIGNYTSQLFANIYLNEIDQYIKHTLKIKYYFRYLDDSVFLPFVCNVDFCHKENFVKQINRHNSGRICKLSVE